MLYGLFFVLKGLKQNISKRWRTCDVSKGKVFIFELKSCAYCIILKLTYEYILPKLVSRFYCKMFIFCKIWFMNGTQFNDNGVLIILCVWEVYPQGVALEFKFKVKTKRLQTWRQPHPLLYGNLRACFHVCIVCEFVSFNSVRHLSSSTWH